MLVEKLFVASKNIYAHLMLLRLVCIFFVLFLSNFALAKSDKDLLDTLIHKGVLTSKEAEVIAKSSVEVSNAVSDSYVKISAKMQTQYAFIDAQNNDLLPSTSELNSFMIRRMILTFDTDNKRNWGAKLSFDFILSNKLSITYLWHKVDCLLIKGELRLGYIKPNFCYEENMSPFNLYCVERSIATYYWGGPRNVRRLGFASFMTGAYWFGQSKLVSGLEYAFAATNSENYKLGYESIGAGQNDAPNFWFSTSYKTKTKDFGELKVGINFGYGANANKEVPSRGASILGVNPYVAFEYADFRGVAEFLISCVESGKKTSDSYENAIPMGLNFLMEQKIDIGKFGKIAPAFRFTWLDTNGRGVTLSDGLRKCSNITGDLPYNNAIGFYFGLNWYIKENFLKFQIGYEFDRFDGVIANSQTVQHSLDANSLRAQIQILF